MKKILVPVDGSELSLYVIEQALEQAKNQESRVTLLTVLPEESFYYGEFMPDYGKSVAMLEAQNTIREEARKNSENMLDCLGEKFEKNHVPVEKSVQSGIPAEKILEMAESGGYHLIVIGNRGFSPAKKFFLGSVSQRVLAGAKCPVLVAKK